MTEKVPMTLDGAEKLRQELTRLKSVDRPAVIEAISEARKHGDLKENAEYHAAKEQQSFIEGRIHEVEAKLAHATVVDVTKLENTGRIVFGVTVRLFDLSTEEIEEYKIVGEDEADIKVKKISVKSPIARALIGHHVGDEIEVVTPSGTRQFEVQEVLYL